MIVCSGLSKRFDDIQALDKVNLQVQQGDIFGLVGPDGAGKTTLIRTICGLISPDKGEVRLLGHPPDAQDEIRSALGYMPQRFSLYGDLTVMENILFFGSLYGLSKKIIIERAEKILTITGMSSFKQRLADKLSGGMKQKLALTSALITRPQILILDEPTYGVDPSSRKEFWKILYQLNQEGLTILVSTPYMDEAELCKQVAFINAGTIRAIDSPRGLRNAFGHQVLEVILDSRDPAVLNGIPGLLDISFYGYKYKVVVADGAAAMESIKLHLQPKNIELISMGEVSPTMEDVFVALAEEGAVKWNTNTQ